MKGNNPVLKFWQKSRLHKLLTIAILFFIAFMFIVLASPQGKKNFQEGFEKAAEKNITKDSPSPSLLASPASYNSPVSTSDVRSQTPSMTAEETFSEIAREKAGGENITVQALKQEDGYWVVTAIVNKWPELFGGNTVKLWAFNFISGVYHTEYPIKQAGITINSSKVEGKYFTAFLGLNQAGSLTEDDWRAFSQTTFYNWLKSVQTGRDETDRANRTFIEENI